MLQWKENDERRMIVAELLNRLRRDRWLTLKEYEQLLLVPETAAARRLADQVRRERYGTRVYLRGLIDIGSICRYDCPQCPQRSSANHTRYRMRPREILDCCDEAWSLGFRNFLLRSGPDSFYTERMISTLLYRLRQNFPGVALTLALGEGSREQYRLLADGGADRYVLLHETADRELYQRTHPAELDFDRRLHCLNELKDAGYQTGCGFLIGDKSAEALAKELKFLEEFQPHAVELISLGAAPETVEYLLSLLRLMLPEVLLTAPEGTVGEVLAGANVMNMSLIRSRKSFPCCCGGRAVGPATVESIAALSRSLADMGFELTLNPAPWNG